MSSVTRNLRLNDYIFVFQLTNESILVECFPSIDNYIRIMTIEKPSNL